MCADPSCWQETAHDPKGHFALQTPDLQPCSHAADNRGTLIKSFFSDLRGSKQLYTWQLHPLHYDHSSRPAQPRQGWKRSWCPQRARHDGWRLDFAPVPRSQKALKKSLEVNLSSVQMVSLFWGVPQKEISKVRAFNLSKKNRDKKEVSSGSYLSLLP